VPQFQIIFNKSRFQSVVPWLMLNPRGPRHSHPPLTGVMADDHTAYALWLGAPIKLKLDACSAEDTESSCCQRPKGLPDDDASFETRPSGAPRDEANS